MKKLFVILMILFTVSAIADITIEIPKDCSIQGTEYSTGGGKKIINYVEIDCLYPNGQYIKHIVNWWKFSGFLGLGRLTMPSQIDFVKTDVLVPRKR